MKEDFLHYVWRYALYSQVKLQTTNSEDIQIVKPGLYNKNTGPDFLNSELIINHQKWVGNVEIHVNASDWYVHQHEKDNNYDAVILHVVWNHDVEVYMKDNTTLPTLELKRVVDGNVINNYQRLINNSLKWIPCEEDIKHIDKFTINHWLESLYFERLEYKTIEIESILETSQNNWEALLFHMLSKNFGLSINGDSFLKLAQSFNFTIVRKEKCNLKMLSALFFGQAGFLEEQLEDEYHIALKKEYIYLKHKYHLKSLQKKEFQFFRMRPSNFPTVRIAQLVALYASKEHLFSSIMNAKSVEDYRLLFEINIDEYWKTHYNFGKPSNRSSKKLTNSFIDLILINTILPLKFYYLKTQGKLSEEHLMNLIKEIKPEKNTIIYKFSDLHIKAENALQTQALIALKNNYCAHKRCLECSIGNQLLRS
ncbi:MAG: DUF2851 family protein [Flavobacteriaceae bacterium]